MLDFAFKLGGLLLDLVSSLVKKSKEKTKRIIAAIARYGSSKGPETSYNQGRAQQDSMDAGNLNKWEPPKKDKK